MSINEQIEAAWEKQGMGVSGHRTSFAAGYRAALRGMYQEVEPSEMVVGRYYWIGGMIGEMQGFQTVTGKDGITRQWPVVNGQWICPLIYVIRGPIPNGSDFPVELFEEEVDDG